MSETSSDQVKRVQQILETLEGQKLTLERVTSNLNRRKIEFDSQIKEDQSAVNSAKLALDQTRIQLRVELKKLDVEIG